MKYKINDRIIFTEDNPNYCENLFKGDIGIIKELSTKIGYITYVIAHDKPRQPYYRLDSYDFQSYHDHSVFRLLIFMDIIQINNNDNQDYLDKLI